MVRLLMGLLYLMVATVLMGVAVTVLLSMNIGDGRNLELAAAGGAVLGLPVTWLLSRRLVRGVAGA